MFKIPLSVNGYLPVHQDISHKLAQHDGIEGISCHFNLILIKPPGIVFLHLHEGLCLFAGLWPFKNFLRTHGDSRLRDRGKFSRGIRGVTPVIVSRWGVSC